MADWKEQSLRVWRKLGKKERYTIIGSAICLMIAILGWSYWWGGKPDMVPLFTGMEAKDAGEVAAKLKEMKITYEPQETSSGTSILVQSKDVHSARLELATQGLPRGKKGFEIFDDSKLGVTEFQNKVNYLQALQGELTRTIEELEEVEKARVHIVLPEDSLYKKNEKPATASIMLKLKTNAQLTKQQVKGIVNLASHSVQGLSPENVTIVDNMGKVLNDPEDDEKSVGNVTLTQLDMTKKIQERLQKDVQSLLDQVIGQGKAVARVNVELSFDQRTMDKQVFEPVVDDSGIVRSSQQTNETYSGSSETPGGPAGTASNIPGYVTANGNNKSDYTKKEVTKNYEINETKEKVVAAPGSIKRLTVAVMVDEQVTPTQQESLQRAVASSIGLNIERGDMISVEALPFSTEAFDKQARAEQDAAAKEQQMFWLQIGLLVLVLGAIVAYFIIKRRRERMEREEQERLAMEALAAKEQAATFASANVDDKEELSPEEQTKLNERKVIEDMIRTRPEDVAQIVKTWLADE